MYVVQLIDCRTTAYLIVSNDLHIISAIEWQVEFMTSLMGLF